MTITGVDIFSYDLPLVRPLTLGEQTFITRSGYLIKLKSSDGHVGWGEAAPITGFSVESAAQVLEELADLKRLLPGLRLPPDPTPLSGQLRNWPTSRWWANSVQCALEMAVLNLIASEQMTPLAGLLSENCLGTIHLNGLIVDPGPVTASARQMQRDGYRAIKLKVGRGSIERDIDRTRDVARELGSTTTLRLDANRAWSYDDACRFAEGIAACEIEYIEEPLADSSRLGELADTTGLAIAWDESTIDHPPDSLPDHPYVKAVILKPTLLGGFERTAAWARQAQKLDTKVVISSCFESSVGIAALAQMAAAYNSFNTPVGLDTLDLFGRDLLEESIDHAHGRMRIAQLSRAATHINVAELRDPTNDRNT